QGTGKNALELRPRRDEIDCAVEWRSLLLVVEVLRDLGDAETPKRKADQMDPVEQGFNLHGEPLTARLDVGADLSEKHPDEAHREPVQYIPGCDKADADEPKQNQRTVLDWSE